MGKDQSGSKGSQGNKGGGGLSPKTGPIDMLESIDPARRDSMKKRFSEEKIVRIPEEAECKQSTVEKRSIPFGSTGPSDSGDSGSTESGPSSPFPTSGSDQGGDGGQAPQGGQDSQGSQGGSGNK